MLTKFFKVVKNKCRRSREERPEVETDVAGRRWEDRNG
jgi:hypothetical protein